MVLPSPENLRGWWGLLWPVLQAATPITLALALVFGTLMGWHLLGEVRRARAANLILWEKVLMAEKAYLELAHRCLPPEGERR